MGISTRITRGSVLEMKQKGRYAYGQVLSTKHKFTDIVRIFQCIEKVKIENPCAALEKYGWWVCFMNVKGEIKYFDSMKVLGKCSIPRTVKVNFEFKWGIRGLYTRKIRRWQICRGATGQPLPKWIESTKLTSAQRKLPILEIVHVSDIFKRIKSGWTPEHECE